MRAIVTALTMLLGIFLSDAAFAGIVIRVDKTTQQMRVLVDGELTHTWAVSSGRTGYDTPRGTYQPYRLHRMWHSRKYNMAPMPYAIFFKGGYAVHGTTAISRLGRTDSHGCIRLHPTNAAQLFALVSPRVADTRVVIEASPSAKPALVAKAKQPKRQDIAAAKPTKKAIRVAKVKTRAGKVQTAALASSSASSGGSYDAASPYATIMRR